MASNLKAFESALEPNLRQAAKPGRKMPASLAPRLRLAAYWGADIASLKLRPVKKEANRLPKDALTPST